MAAGVECDLPNGSHGPSARRLSFEEWQDSLIVKSSIQCLSMENGYSKLPLYLQELFDGKTFLLIFVKDARQSFCIIRQAIIRIRLLEPITCKETDDLSRTTDRHQDGEALSCPSHDIGDQVRKVMWWNLGVCESQLDRLFRYDLIKNWLWYEVATFKVLVTVASLHKLCCQAGHLLNGTVEVQEPQLVWID